MLIGGIDLETTGLDVNNDFVTEVGFVIWDTDTQKPIVIFNELVWAHNYPSLSDDIIRITGLTDGILVNHGSTPEKVFGALVPLMLRCHYIVAHNGNDFDRPMLESNMKRAGLSVTPQEWVDTTIDVPYPQKISTRHLNYLAAEHGILNPFKHRAVFDVLTMLAMLSAYNFQEVLAYRAAPSVKVIAKCEKPWLDDGLSTNNAKSLGFRWDGANKQWQQSVKEVQLQNLREKAASLSLVVQEV